MIRAENISKSFSGEPVIENISVTMNSGKANMIIGSSGTGKTVLLKCLLGIHKIDSGDIFYDNRSLNSMSVVEKRELRKEIGMLFQGSALFDSMTVEENVMFPLTMFTENSYEEKIERVNFCLKRVNLNNVNKLYPSHLSGGMMKRVAIARAIVMKPRYLFCDEPNSGLDPKTSLIIDNLIKEIAIEFDMVAIINTHDMNSVMSIADYIYFIHDGKIWWEGDKTQILYTNNKELNEFVFASELAKQAKQNMKNI